MSPVKLTQKTMQMSYNVLKEPTADDSSLSVFMVWYPNSFQHPEGFRKASIYYDTFNCKSSEELYYSLIFQKFAAPFRGNISLGIMSWRKFCDLGE